VKPVPRIKYNKHILILLFNKTSNYYFAAPSGCPPVNRADRIAAPPVAQVIKLQPVASSSHADISREFVDK
jgi:hypothetical protein